MRSQKSKLNNSKRNGGARPVAASLPKISAKAIGKRGFAEATLITEWDRVVGLRLARVSQPEKLVFPSGQRKNGTLHIRVQGGVATELQHLEPLVVEQINSHFGYGAVGKLRLSHSPLRQIPPHPKHRRRTPDSKQRAVLAVNLDEVEDDELREALERLEAAMISNGGEIKKS